MKKHFLALIIGILVLSGLGAGAIQSNDIKSAFENNVYQEPVNSLSPRDYTHTVLVEAGMRKGCPSCPATNAAWKSIYASGNYDFEFVSLIYEQNTKAYQRFLSFNPAWVPTSYFDGGQYVCVGTSYATFYSYLDSAGSRTVPDLDATLSALWLGDAKIEISLSIENNDNNNYPGTLRVYVVELISPRWTDYNNQPYGHALLDFPWQQTININSGDTFSDSKVWDGAVAGYPDIDPENIQVILAVFDDTPHQSYSDPPSGNPFWAYYSDECISVILEEEPTNDPPNAPTIEGPREGKVNALLEYTFSSTDPDGDQIESYIVNWGDSSGYETITGPFNSGQAIKANHTWTEKGTYVIFVKAKDIKGAQGPSKSLSISIPRARNYYTSVYRFLEQHPNLFMILKLVLQHIQ